MVELDPYNSVGSSDSGVGRSEAEALDSASPETKTFSRLAAGFITNTMRAAC
jgi:hypothetical protein